MNFPTDANEYKFVFSRESDEELPDDAFRCDNLQDLANNIEFNIDYDAHIQGYCYMYWCEYGEESVPVNSIKDIEILLEGVTCVTKNGENIDKEDVIEAIWEKFNEMKSKRLEYEIKKLDTKRLALEKQLNSITKENYEMQTFEKDNNNVVKVNKERE